MEPKLDTSPILKAEYMSSPNRFCSNCNAPLTGPYCSQCGQSQKGIRQDFWVLLEEAFEGVFRIDSKVSKSLHALFTKPGKLSAEYCDNKRATYTPPFRLYLISSILFFFILTTINFFGLNFQVNSSSPVDTVPVEQTLKPIEKFQSFIQVDPEDRGIIRDLKMAAKSDLKQLIADVYDKLPLINFLLVPIYALLLELMFKRAERFYSEHFVLVLHNSSFYFLIFAFMFALQPWLGPIPNVILMASVLIWTALYQLFSYKRMYQESWLSLINKSLFMGVFQVVSVNLAMLLSIYLTIKVGQSA